MCGIVGIYQRDGAPIDLGTLRAMMELQRHRGPDDDGARLFSLRHGSSVDASEQSAVRDGAPLEGGVGVNRLSILDLSERGHQPMSTPDGQVLIAYNGETYNAFDLRPDLEAKGHEFHSNTDTEVLLHLYREHGIGGMLERMNGMFALCIVDLRERCVYLVRDRLGIKPLYWYERDGLYLFASEVKSFHAHAGFTPTVDGESLDEFLAFSSTAWDGFLLGGFDSCRQGTGCESAPTASHYTSTGRYLIRRRPAVLRSRTRPRRWKRYWLRVWNGVCSVT